MTWRRTETQLVAALKLAGIDVHQVDGNQYMLVISLGGCQNPDECVAECNAECAFCESASPTVVSVSITALARLLTREIA